MAQMTACRGCGAEVAATAKTCPACGQTRPGLDEKAAKAHAAATVAYTAGCLILLAFGVVTALALLFFIVF